MSPSVFEVIGPPMVGPSSSHTAGACRIGWAARELLGAIPETARIGLHGSFYSTGQGHGTDEATVAGLLGLRPDDARLKDSFALAERKGLRFEIGEVDLGAEAHPNSVVLDLRAGATALSLRAASTGGGSIQLEQIDSFPVDLRGTLETLVLWHVDVAGFLARITALLADAPINVASIRTSRSDRGGRTLTTLEIDGRLPAEVLTVIRCQEAITRWAHLPVLPGF